MTPITPAKELIARLTLEDMLELNQFLVSEIKSRRNKKGQTIKATLGYSDKVSWVNSKSGVRMHGEIVKVMRKYAKVNVPGGPFGQQWRVPLSMLRKEA